MISQHYHLVIKLEDNCQFSNVFFTATFFSHAVLPSLPPSLTFRNLVFTISGKFFVCTQMLLNLCALPFLLPRFCCCRIGKCGLVESTKYKSGTLNSNPGSVNKLLSLTSVGLSFFMLSSKHANCYRTRYIRIQILTLQLTLSPGGCYLTSMPQFLNCRIRIVIVLTP